MAFMCRTCGSKLRVRTSSGITDTVRQVYYECPNNECMERYTGTHELGHIIQPSLKKIPQISLDFFLNSVPENKRNAVLKILGSE